MIKDVAELSELMIKAVKAGYVYAKMEDLGDNVNLDLELTNYISVTVANAVVDQYLNGFYKS